MYNNVLLPIQSHQPRAPVPFITNQKMRKTRSAIEIIFSEFTEGNVGSSVHSNGTIQMEWREIYDEGTRCHDQCGRPDRGDRRRRWEWIPHYHAHFIVNEDVIHLLHSNQSV